MSSLRKVPKKRGNMTKFVRISTTPAENPLTPAALCTEEEASQAGEWRSHHGLHLSDVFVGDRPRLRSKPSFLEWGDVRKEKLRGRDCGWLGLGGVQKRFEKVNAVNASDGDKVSCCTDRSLLIRQNLPRRLKTTRAFCGQGHQACIIVHSQKRVFVLPSKKMFLVVDAVLKVACPRKFSGRCTKCCFYCFYYAPASFCRLKLCYATHKLSAAALACSV